MPGTYKPRKKWLVLHKELHQGDMNPQLLQAQMDSLRNMHPRATFPGVQVRSAKRCIKAFCAGIHCTVIVVRVPVILDEVAK